MLGTDPFSRRIEPDFVATVLAVVRERTGVDFSAYRPAMLERRIGNHFAAVGAATPAEYLQRLRGSAEEPYRLLERITIKVSRFYRHAPAFDFLRDTVLPELARKERPLRIACVGCGAGEEPYTFAMLLDHAGFDGVIEATDIDASALEAAHAGHYPPSAAAELPATFADTYLEPVVERGQPSYLVQDNLRSRVHFGRADITLDAPGFRSDFDLVSCRNVLIYLQRSAQLRATRNLLAMTRNDGVLCLGEAEWPLPEFQSQLEPLPHRTRLFRVLRSS